MFLFPPPLAAGLAWGFNRGIKSFLGPCCWHLPYAVPGVLDKEGGGLWGLLPAAAACTLVQVGGGRIWLAEAALPLAGNGRPRGSCLDAKRKVSGRLMAGTAGLRLLWFSAFESCRMLDEAVLANQRSVFLQLPLEASRQGTKASDACPQQQVVRGTLPLSVSTEVLSA